jgi:DNA-binding MarR family transcriptional regulator
MSPAAPKPPATTPAPRRTARARAGYYGADNYRVEESIGYLMKVTVESLSREIDERMAEHGLTDAQWRPLLLLSQREAQTAAQLARHASCDAGAMTRMLDRIEDKGLVRRVRSTDDRRVQNLELTAEGRHAASVVPRVICEVLNAHLEGLAHDEVDQLKDLLQRVAATSRARAAARHEKEDAP